MCIIGLFVEKFVYLLISLNYMPTYAASYVNPKQYDNGQPQRRNPPRQSPGSNPNDATAGVSSHNINVRGPNSGSRQNQRGANPQRYQNSSRHQQ